MKYSAYLCVVVRVIFVLILLMLNFFSTVNEYTLCFAVTFFFW